MWGEFERNTVGSGDVVGRESEGKGGNIGERNRM